MLLVYRSSVAVISNVSYTCSRFVALLILISFANMAHCFRALDAVDPLCGYLFAALHTLDAVDPLCGIQVLDAVDTLRGYLFAACTLSMQ